MEAQRLWLRNRWTLWNEYRDTHVMKVTYTISLGAILNDSVHAHESARENEENVGRVNRHRFTFLHGG